MRVVSLNIGRPSLLVRNERRYSTAINRRPVAGPVLLELTGFEGDRVADAESHGGPDKAVCCYPHEHYAHWNRELGLDLAVPSFGENLTTEGLLESEMCIGDVFRIGDAVVQISQPRQPCWKLANHRENPELPKLINEMGYTGFYLRVLKPGQLTGGDTITISERPHPGLTVLLTTRTFLAHRPDRGLLKCMVRVPELSASWQKRMADKLDAAG